jgi:hypothetical protein
VVYFSQVRPLPKSHMHISFLRYGLHAQPITLTLIPILEHYLVRSTNTEANTYAVSSSSLLLSPTYVQICSSASKYQTPSAYVPPSVRKAKF